MNLVSRNLPREQKKWVVGGGELVDNYRVKGNGYISGSNWVRKINDLTITCIIWSWLQLWYECLQVHKDQHELICIRFCVSHNFFTKDSTKLAYCFTKAWTHLFFYFLFFFKPAVWYYKGFHSVCHIIFIKEPKFIFVFPVFHVIFLAKEPVKL